jgi:AraC family transcriptional regulator
LAIDGLLLEILAEVTRERSPEATLKPTRWLTKIHDLIHDRFTERLSLETIAGAVGVHPMHLCRVFRKQYGCSVGQYIRRLRLERATRDLVSSRKAAVEVALDAGYSDQSHFTNDFSRHTGMTPIEFRRLLRPR